MFLLFVRDLINLLIFVTTLNHYRDHSVSLDYRSAVALDTVNQKNLLRQIDAQRFDSHCQTLPRGSM